MPIAHGDVIRVEAMGQPVSNSYRAVPLPGMPGLGLIVRWMGYDTNGVALTPVAPTVPSTTIISDSSWVQVVRARTTRDYIMTQKYRFELIIIDENQYKGGLLTFVEEYKVTVHTSTQQGTNVYQQCRDGVIDPMAALIGTVQVPELPRPVVTTCRFSADTLNQKVTLGAVDPSQITDTTTLRPEGTAGQNSFLITGTNCNKGAKIDFYLTDARDQSTNKDYLRTTNPAVGIRLFYRGEYEPMPFGPPPSGSWVPSRYAGSLGPAPTEGATLTSGFTAQYVRLPNYSQGDIKPGPLTAEAIVVIVYP
ncbi:fimbrial protein [Paenalcaligenes sp. Me131]